MSKVRTIFAAAMWLIFSALPLQAGLLTGQAPTHLANAGTRASVGLWDLVQAGPTYFQTRSYHYFPNGAPNVAPLLQGWRGNGNSDPAIGLNLPIGMEIEILNGPSGSPGSGSCTQLLFGGSTSGTLVSGSQLQADPGPTIPPNTGIYFYMNWGSNTGSVPYGGYSTNTSIGDAMDSSTSPVAHTPCGAVNNTVGGSSTLTVPSAFLASTAFSTPCIVGDSIGNGSSDTAQALTGLIGYFQRVLGQTLGFINFSISGTSAKQFSASTAPKRIALAKLYCTIIVSELGINSFIVDHVGFATAETDLSNAMSAFSGGVIKGWWQSTLMPWVNDAANTIPGSTTGANCSDRTTYNTWIKTVPAGMAGVFDVASVTEDQSTACLWANTNYLFNSNPWVHPNSTGTAATVNSGIVPLSVFTWP